MDRLYPCPQPGRLLWQQALGGNYGDWLNGDTLVLKDYPRGISAVRHDLLATAFFAHSTGIVAKMAKALGREKDAATYDKLAAEVRRAFQKENCHAGRPDSRRNPEAGYRTLALNFHLLEDSGPAAGRGPSARAAPSSAIGATLPPASRRRTA